MFVDLALNSVEYANVSIRYIIPRYCDIAKRDSPEASNGSDIDVTILCKP